MGLEEGYQERTILFYTTYALEDQKEGMQTFIEKLEPDFENSQWLVVVKIYDNSWTACARFIL
jgi:1,4-dihydroxy-2-naphthoyl-CoA synthase